MGFVQTAFLAGLAGLSIPILIHLIFRWQTRRVELGTVRFLSELLRETARRRRLKRWLLLSLRLAIVALLVLLFARPYLLAMQAAGGRRQLVVLVDRSASMALRTDGERAVDRATERADELIRRAGPDADVSLAFFDESVHPAGRDHDDPPPQLHRATNYGPAMQWARDLAVRSPLAAREVYVLTDLQRSGLDWSEPVAFPPDVAVHVEDFGRPDVNNAAVAAAVPTQTLLRVGEAPSVRVTLFNHGPFPLEDVPLRVSLRQGRRAHHRQESVSLPAREALELSFDFPALGAGLWEGLAELEAEDDLRFDNRRHFAVLTAPPRKVLIVDGSGDEEGGGVLPGTFFLERALRLAPPGETSAESPFVPTVTQLDEAGTLPPLDGFDLVVLSDVGGLSAADAERLAERVRGGVGLLVFTGPNVTAESTASLADVGLVPGRIGQPRFAADLPFRWESWDASDPLLEVFADPQHGDLRRLDFVAYTPLAPAPSARVLARFSREDPALVLARAGAGRVLWFLSSAGRQWGGWTRSRLFLPLVHQMLGDLAGLTGGGPVQYEEPGARGEGRESGPAGGEPIDRAGVHRRDGRWLVVNVSPRESETDRATPAEFAHRFEFFESSETESAATSPTAAAARTGRELRADEIWHWLLWPLLACVCLEFFVANRTTA